MLKITYQGKQLKLQWLKSPSEINVEILKNIRCATSRYFWNKINELATKSKNKNTRGLYRGTNKFKRGYQHISYLARDENGVLLEDSYNM
jgi:hypothetical protein